MIDGVQDVYYNVQDMGRAVAFYRDVLGLEVTREDKWWTSLDCGGVRIGLHWTEGDAVPAVPKDDHGAHAGGTLTFKTRDAKAAKALLVMADAKILGEADAPWGHMVIFEDPDGNVLKLMQPKY